MKENQDLSEVFNQEKNAERQEVRNASDAVVKPDTRNLPPSRKGKRQVATWVTPEGHRAVKIAAAMRDCTVEEFTREAINAELRAMGKPPIA